MATIAVPRVVPSPAEDAAALLKAFQGWGTDEQAVIGILAHRDATQREQIALEYEHKYGESLVQRLQSELTGDFERAVYHWMLGPAERQAVMANAATECLQEECAVIVEIACANSSAELVAVKKAYHALYRRSLEEDVAARATAGNLRSLLLALVSTYRYDGADSVDMELARSEAKAVHEAVRDGGGAGGHEELIRVVGTRSKAQLRATFGCFKDEHRRSVAKALPRGTDPTGYLRALRAAVRCVADPSKYFAKVLRSATRESAGTDEDSLARVVLLHAEKDDMGAICAAFLKRASCTLEQAVAKETSGDYRSFLLALLGS
ncbi:annexin-like protein RJ4 [Zea mays]|uniref:Annexin n=1 Tax=Zea mays TaxID=4577 RepID=A0A096Q9Q0_MAIZE|nr:annexin-like protein RJ4 [Zea mays]ALH43513.1 annexin [Zea mays]|eukprot:XP_008673676.1 annexin-like protein RJ4 [Zea mays]